MSNRLSGISPLSYQGTNAVQPPNIRTFERAPTQNDTQNFSLGDFWIHRKSRTTNDSDLYWLAGIAGGSADWDLISSSNGTIAQLTGDNNFAVLPLDGNINIQATNTCGPTVEFTGSGSTLTLNVTDAAMNTSIGLNSSINLNGGINNVVFGSGAATNVITASNNVIIGAGAGTSITDFSRNTIIGYLANSPTGGQDNICIGQSSGGQLTTTDSFNILIGSAGMPGDNLIIRIGNYLTGMQKTFIEGIRDVTTDMNDAIPVLIDSTGQLGTVSSSARYKEDINDMGDSSSPLMQLRPVTFVYKNDRDKLRRYGLIAEEVAEVFPAMAIFDEEGLPTTVRYHELITLLLNEVQKLEKRVKELERNTYGSC